MARLFSVFSIVGVLLAAAGSVAVAAASAATALFWDLVDLAFPREPGLVLVGAAAAPRVTGLYAGRAFQERLLQRSSDSRSRAPMSAALTPL